MAITLCWRGLWEGLSEPSKERYNSCRVSNAVMSMFCSSTEDGIAVRVVQSVTSINANQSCLLPVCVFWAFLHTLDAVHQVQDFIAKGGDVNKPDREHCSPLMWACWGGHVEIVKRLLDEGAK